MSPAFLSPFKCFVCSCLKGGTVWIRTDIKVKAQRLCRLNLQLFFFFWTSAQNWILLLAVGYLVFSSACELVMLEFKAWFISICTCFSFNTMYITPYMCRLWKSGPVLWCGTFLKPLFLTLQPWKCKLDSLLHLPFGNHGVVPFKTDPYLYLRLEAGCTCPDKPHFYQKQYPVQSCPRREVPGGRRRTGHELGEGKLLGHARSWREGDNGQGLKQSVRSDAAVAWVHRGACKPWVFPQ